MPFKIAQDITRARLNVEEWSNLSNSQFFCAKPFLSVFGISLPRSVIITKTCCLIVLQVKGHDFTVRQFLQS